ncbi:MAG: hypothetical protein QME58_13080 [Bacteroidota bacterium]|nr:hypothetical protein [Bacteroidota bacterium]
MKTQINFSAILMLSLCLITLFFPIVSIAQTDPHAVCGFTGMGSTKATQLGGMWMTPRDTLHVLVVFVQFPDDRYDTAYSLWPTFPAAGRYPGPTYLNTYIDSVVSQMSTNGNLSHYFRDMSMGALKLTGKTRFVVTPQTNQWYQNNNWNRWMINREVLQVLDASLDFAEFDRWKRYGVYDIRREPDSLVDMIFMIYRRVEGAAALAFHGGEASLGYARNYPPHNEPISFYVDSGQRRIGHGHPVFGHPGSGTTSEIGGTGDGWFGLLPYRVQIHELAHHWMTNGPDYGHNGGGFWATLNHHLARFNSASVSCINSFERELLGWHYPDSIGTSGGFWYNLTLTDFITTNKSYKIKVPGSNPNEFFRLEYHQRISQFDAPDMHDQTAKGLYIIHQSSVSNPQDDNRLVPADGRWNWSVQEVGYVTWYSGPLPVFKKTGIDIVNGYNDSWKVPFTWPIPPYTPDQAEVILWRDRITNDLIELPLVRGDGNDAFCLGKNTVFSPWSNPSSQNAAKKKTWIAIEIVNESNGVVTFDLHIDSTNCLLTSPSKPQDLHSLTTMPKSTTLKWTANQEPDLIGYKVHRWTLLPDGSEINYTLLTPSIITTTSYTDNNYDPITGLPQNIDLYHRYRITAVDNQGKESVKSEYVDAYFTHVASGIISSNKTYIINVNVLDNVTVQNGVTLIINLGTRVVFENGKSLTVNGKLIAKGNQNNRITFTSANQSPSPGDWGGIVFSGGGPDTLTYCNIKYAENGLRFINTAANCYMANDTVSNSSGYGVAVSSTGASNTALRIYKSAIKNNRTEGIRVNNARVSISNSRVENNGSGNINSGIIVINAGRLFIDSSFVTNNLGSGIDISGIGSRVSLSPDEIKRGYNTVTGHGLSEIYVRNSATALLGYRAAINYCICEMDPVDKSESQLIEDLEIVSKGPACPPGCYPAVRYEARAGWNNVYNNFTYSCRLINNATTNTVQARYNYWGSGSSMFCGPVDTLSQRGSPVNTPAKLENTDIYTEEQFSKEDRTRMREWLLQLQSDIESNKTNSIDALYQLALYVGPGGEFSDALEMPWEFLLTSVERNSRLSNVKSLASVLLVTAKMDRGEFLNAIYISDQILLTEVTQKSHSERSEESETSNSGYF